MTIATRPDTTFTAREKANEAKREVAQRQWVYSNLVMAGKLKADDATYRLDVMKEIARDYEAAAQVEERGQRLL